MASVEPLVAFLSGVPLVVLGAALLALRPRQRPQQFFAVFAICWGAQVALANLGRAIGAPSDFYQTSSLVSFALIPPMYIFLVHFATTTRPLKRRFAPTAAFAAIGLAGGIVLAAAPSLVLVSVGRLADGTLVQVFGPAVLPLFAIPFYGAFYLALALLYLQYRQAAPGSPRHRARGLLLALGLFVSFATVQNLLSFATSGANAGGATRVAAPFGQEGLALLFLAGSLLLAGLVAHLVIRPPPPEQRDTALITGLLAPAVVAVAGFATNVDTVGFWRLASVGVIVYVLARHQLFDLELRVKRHVGAGVAGLALGLGVVGGLLAVLSGVASPLPPLLVGAVVAGAAWGGRERLGEALFPDASDAPDYLYQRKLDVYRASLEQALGQPSDPGASAELRKLRKQLGISEREHAVMAFMVRQAPAPPPPAPTGAPAPLPLVEPGAVFAGRYRVDRLLGEGGHGRAYLAFDEQAQREVVVKAVGLHALGGKAASLLLREARILAKLRHPHIIAIHDVVESPREAVIVMEYADGGSLYAHLRRVGKLGRREAVELLDQILAGLEAAHAKGVVHRDVKPENILRMRDGAVKLADFGIARASSDEGTAMTAGPVGTLLYMSPEQVRGLAVDARTDLYAAAVVFHQALTGHFYLRIAGKDDFQVRQLILRSVPQLGVEDAALERFLAKALAKDAEARFPSAAEMRRALGAAAAPGKPAP